MAKTLALFRQTKALENEIDQFLDTISRCALVFQEGIALYLDAGLTDEFDEKLQHANQLESTADHLRRSVETQLYAHTLIPDSRGDVLGLLENMDTIANDLEGALWAFSIEQPEIPTDYHHDYRSLTEKVILAVESLVMAARAFFRNIEAVGDHNHKVMFYEKEADKASTKLKRAIFSSDLPLSHKSHLRSFVEHIDNVADTAEDVADRLTIYTIKRTV